MLNEISGVFFISLILFKKYIFISEIVFKRESGNKQIKNYNTDEV